MSFDLVLWPGSPRSPSRAWASVDAPGATRAEGMPVAALLTAFRAAFDRRLRVSGDVDGFDMYGPGWEGTVVHAPPAQISCRWSILDDKGALLEIIQAAHVAGCSVYDPQWEGYWAVSDGPPAEDPWSSALFVEGIEYASEDDQVGAVAARPLRLRPHDSWPPGRKVWIEAPLALTRKGRNTYLLSRARTYAKRFPGWELEVVFTGPDTGSLTLDECKQLLPSRSLATPTVDDKVGVIVFSAIGAFDALAVMESVAPCPFELLAISEDERILQGLFGDPPLRLWVTVPTRAIAIAPDSVRAGLRSLFDAASASCPVYFNDPCAPKGTPVGTNVAWVETLLGLPTDTEPATVPADAVPQDIAEE